MTFPEGREWVAHCLDLDLVETGTTAEAAVDALVEAVRTQFWYARAHDNFGHLFQPAPREAWQRFGEILQGPYRIVVRTVHDPDQEFTLESLSPAAA